MMLRTAIALIALLLCCAACRTHGIMTPITLGRGAGHAAPATRQAPVYLRAASEDGKYVALSDGSVWEISLGGQYTVRMWMPGAEIFVVPIRGWYPYLLVNTFAGNKVEANALR